MIVSFGLILLKKNASILEIKFKKKNLPANPKIVKPNNKIVCQMICLKIKENVIKKLKCLEVI